MPTDTNPATWTDDEIYRLALQRASEPCDESPLTDEQWVTCLEIEREFGADETLDDETQIKIIDLFEALKASLAPVVAEQAKKESL